MEFFVRVAELEQSKVRTLRYLRLARFAHVPMIVIDRSKSRALESSP